VTSTCVAKGECSDLITAADKAIGQQQRLIDLKTQEIGIQDTIIKAQDTKITELEKKSNLFSSPVTYIVIGILAGVYIRSKI
jgi:hypothetical protein